MKTITRTIGTKEIEKKEFSLIELYPVNHLKGEDWIVRVQNPDNTYEINTFRDIGAKVRALEYIKKNYKVFV